MPNTSSLMPPLWLRYPFISECSIGWRMGFGEGYAIEFNKWFGSLTDGEKSRYREMFPTPVTWPYHDLDEDEDEEEDFEDEYEDDLGIQFWRPGGEPAYTLATLTQDWSARKPRPLRYFWKPSPGSLDEACLGQWQPTPFRVDIDHFSCAEQYMMAAKARLFEDKETRAKIMDTDDPGKMKSLGKQVRGFDHSRWDAAKYSIVLAGNWAKFTQDSALRGFLLSTNDDVLVEASPLDRIWGIGLSSTHDKASDPRSWRGQNLLGFALMEVRDEIRRVYANEHLVDASQYED